MNLPATTLITGCAGFIGMHCAERLLAQGQHVIGVDNLNSYYDVALKQARLARLQAHPHFLFAQADIADRNAMHKLFAHTRPQRVLHLAAQAGVRYSIEQPDDYTDSNLLGFGHILQGCRAASHSSTYVPANRLCLSRIRLSRLGPKTRLKPHCSQVYSGGCTP